MRSRREARLANVPATSVDGEATDARTSVANATAAQTAAAVSRRAARAAAIAAAESTSETSAAAPDAVAASTVAIVRPHAQKAGRRAAEAFSDEIEKPVGGRRAIVSRPTTALPPTDDSVAGDATPLELEVEIVVAEAVSDSRTGATPVISPIIETAAIPVIKTAAPILPATLADEPAAPVKPVSRRTLRSAAIVPAERRPNDATPASGTSSTTTGTGAGHADDAKPPTGRRSRRNIAKGGFSALALIFATGIAVATSMPAEALHAAAESPRVSILASERALADTAPGQQLTTSSDVAGANIARDGYGVRDTAALQAAGFRIADTFTNNPRGAIQWPFPVGVPISDGFGARESPGGIGSTDHKGVDFAPGQGTPIQSIADGVVSSVEPYDNSGLGVHVIIDHVVDGQKVSSVYGHMLTGSIQVSEGQVVKVAQTVGLVGNTGASTGPHLHLEIRLDGVTPVDPFAWLESHAV
ncbi:M23 family metallopeptidase [Herbiconiux sp. CPCC 205763]|uniref:M23 family metallopeptidase n=1 Tax=Herbiconiux aconitum TaxID=2970913 RepID=A0ABT2GL42_9MICO|nr:M23 family metallopeptidase [Herbiconiux aconitum]MCS5716936.1 M23 family metallopeptidase [Herbiconiux aconitum]